MEGIPTSTTNLRISSCALSDLYNCFNLKNLISLDASDNNLSEISALVDCSRLQNLNLQYNQINNIYLLLRIVKKCADLLDLDAR